MLYLFLGIALVTLLFVPQLWARYTLKRYNTPRPDFPGNGGQLARHLLDQFHIGHVKLENTQQGDHYDPATKTVRLSPAHLEEKSLTAIAIAAHEVSHAIQDHSNYRPFVWRIKIINIAQKIEKFGSGIMFALPIIAAITRSPTISAAAFFIGLASMATMTLAHLITLPVEWDASFGKALPILKSGGYINEKDEAQARKVLRACALTYAAASLASLFNMWRWLRLLRR